MKKKDRWKNIDFLKRNINLLLGYTKWKQLMLNYENIIVKLFYTENKFEALLKNKSTRFN